MTNKKLNVELRKLWDANINELKEFYDCKNNILSPMIFPEDSKTTNEDILFIGLNPSFSENTIKKHKANPSIFYYKNYDLNKNDIIEYETKNKDDDFFNKIEGVSNNHSKKIIDLYFIRKTNQKDFVSNFINKYSDFANKQLELSKELILESKQKLIVVINAKASEIIKEQFNIQETDFDDKIGTYRIKLNNKKIPVIFSGMLSGQRALDKGSFRRLQWQIESILSGKRMQ